MFHIFRKKKFLVDYLGGFVDIHNHILPGIDDGAKTVEESLQLLHSFSELGITNFIATPHIMDHYYPNTAQTIQQSLTRLQNELHKLQVPISIEAAAEHMIDANFEHLLERQEVMPIKKRYLLIEMSYLQASLNFSDAVQKISTAQYFPIFAHPERYQYLHHTAKYEAYKNNGLLFQLNVLSLGNYYGSEVTKVAHQLLDTNLIDFVGTDVHNLKQLEALKNIKLSAGLVKKIVPILEKTNYNFG
ncbi:tyrosine-protein phosphatase [Cellulophaga sp. Hel_I_12]|uniref:tyrosine-protein phosphatase n=1 Tax=Cellulophaga sp. Hel_I_12 TaxID=1249972 RepID=UPI000646578F|nr:CpsB/CapC family capsule biosynthesis tyrosine phosphatase [Cellulophaga sp. Hel_I_12]